MCDRPWCAGMSEALDEAVRCGLEPTHLVLHPAAYAALEADMMMQKARKLEWWRSVGAPSWLIEILQAQIVEGLGDLRYGPDEGIPVIVGGWTENEYTAIEVSKPIMRPL